MMVRMWHGRVPTAKAKAYREFLNERAIPDYRSVAGSLSVHILEREEREVTHFITLTFWQDLELDPGLRRGGDRAGQILPGRPGFPAGVRAGGGTLPGGRARLSGQPLNSDVDQRGVGGFYPWSRVGSGLNGAERTRYT